MAGYAADVAEKDISFREFALRCTRVFGPLIQFRDEDMNKLITEIPLDTSYYDKALQDAETELVKFEQMPPEQKTAMAEADIRSEREQMEKSRIKAQTENDRLACMLAKVEAWNPPTKEHVAYRDYMIELLRGSLNDMLPYTISAPDLTPGEWLACHEETLRRNVEYYRKELTKEYRLNAERNVWLKAVVDSLPEE